MTAKTRKQPKMASPPNPEDWEQWSAYLVIRQKPVAPWQLIPSRRGSPLGWGLSASALSGETGRLLSKLESWMGETKLRPAKVIKWLEPWLSAAEGRKTDAGFAMECLGWAYLLPNLASVLPAAVWSEVFDYLAGAAAGAEDGDSGQPLAEQVLAGELPLVLSYQFPELGQCTQLGAAARRKLKAGVKDLLDGNGLLHCRDLAILRPLLACWTRCSYLARTAGTPLLGSKAQLKFEWFVRQTLQLTRQDGSQVLCDGTECGHEEELFDAALLLNNDAVDHAISDQILPWRKANRAASQRKTFFPDSSDHSAWARVAILRPNWLRGGQKLVVTYDGTVMNTELTCGATTLWSGTWETRITVGESQLEPISDWEELCWHSDDDVDYLELELKFNNNWHLQRQIVMAREDQFLFTADALVGPQTAAIDYNSCLPLSSDIDFLPENETREGYLVGKRPIARVLPLVLPEWRTLYGEGSLERLQAGLCSQRQTESSRFYWPLFIDLDRQRIERPVTWRHLTVAESLDILPPSETACYRVQAGDEHWLFYRSLVPAACRTFLGQHVSHEFFAARFDREGEAEELIAINSEG